MRKLFKERKLFKGRNYMRKYGSWNMYIKCIVQLDMYISTIT